MYTSLKAAFAAIIATTGRREITASQHRTAIDNVIDELGKLQLKGVAVLATDPGTPDGPAQYLAATAGVYSHFNDLSVSSGEIALFKRETAGVWVKESLVTGLASQQYVDNLIEGLQDDIDTLELDMSNAKSDITTLEGKTQAFGVDGKLGQDLDADGNKITGLAAGEDDGDAVNYNQLKKSQSVFVDNVYLINQEITDTLTEAIKGLFIENYNGETFALSLFYTNSSLLTMNLKYYDGSAWQNAVFAGTDLQTGLATYEWNSVTWGVIRIIVDMDILNAGTELTNNPTDLFKAVFKTISKYDKDYHIQRIDNPHAVTKSQVGLGDADNTSDFNKPLSDIANQLSDSIFYKNSVISTATKSMHLGIKKLHFSKDVSDKSFAFNLLFKSGTNFTINIYDITDASNPISFIYASFPYVEGISAYSKSTTNYGTVTIVIDKDIFDLYGYLSNPVDDLSTAKVKHFECGTEYDSTTERALDYDVFVPGASLFYNTTDHTEAIKKAIRSVRTYGDTTGLKLMLTELLYNAETHLISSICIGSDHEGQSRYEKREFNVLNYQITDPDEFETIVFSPETASLSRAYPDVIIEIDIKASFLLGNLRTSTTENVFEKRGFLRIQKMDSYSPAKHNSISDMLCAGGGYPVQFANCLPYRLNNNSRLSANNYGHTIDNFTPMWNAFKLRNEPIVEHLTCIPPTVVGFNNNYALLGSVGLDDIMYLYGVYDHNGRLYTSDDDGVTLTLLIDLLDEFPTLSFYQPWAFRVLPNNELIYIATCTTSEHPTGLDERRTYAFVSSNNQTVWQQCEFEAGGNFEFCNYQEGSGDAITFQDPGKLLDGWGFDAYRNFIIMVGYGDGLGTPDPGLGHSGTGYMTQGSIFLSEDYGLTFKEVFDYFNIPSTCSALDPAIGGHHSHGCFIDHYKITDGNPRIFGIFGDDNTRLVFSDDLGVTWLDNYTTKNGYQQSVSGKAIPQGAILGTDAVTKQGVEILHRGESVFYADEMHRTISTSDEALALSGQIVHVGAMFYQRNPEFPIITGFTPETSGRFASGTRGIIVASWDGGLTWTTLFTDRDTNQYWNGITSLRIFQDSKKQIWISPAQFPNNFDGVIEGRMIKITY